MRTLAVVLWEDQLSLGARTFGPHQLLLACVADRTETHSHWDLNEVILGLPRKGADKLRSTLAAQGAKLTADGAALVAVFDEDKVRNVYSLRPTASHEDIKAAIRKGSATPVTIVLLERNIETIVKAAAQILSRPLPAKSPNERDTVLMALATSPERHGRDALCQQVPSFADLVATLVDLHQSEVH